MRPIDHFDAVWLRCDGISAIHAFLSANSTNVLQTDELLRAEWVARVAALDLYVHELVAQRMQAIFTGSLPATKQYLAFTVPIETMERIRLAASVFEAAAAFDLEVRRQGGLVTYQDPEKIADGLRLCSSVELWNAVASHQGAPAAQQNKEAKNVKQQLRAIVDRRNKIAHEGDLQPTSPATPWSIQQSDLVLVRKFIEKTVRSIDAVV